MHRLTNERRRVRLRRPIHLRLGARGATHTGLASAAVHDADYRSLAPQAATRRVQRRRAHGGGPSCCLFGGSADPDRRKAPPSMSHDSGGPFSRSGEACTRRCCMPSFAACSPQREREFGRRP
ncbi:hypothetical protein HPB47_023642 [Ixodes persulcatus]|uniref:Uncharacterized protein n=1 Tax=Ixodes persulcatus TaxID=34615 RepID=A0AC60Q8R5_IXOPE|nr:hypothetical protein HPB47_023642 [Ixodes persulcatus]